MDICLHSLTFSPLQSKFINSQKKKKKSPNPAMVLISEWIREKNNLKERNYSNFYTTSFFLPHCCYWKPLIRPLKRTTHLVIWSKRLMVLLQLLSLLKSLSSCFLWLYYLHLSMNPLYQLFPSVIKFAEHHHRNRINAMFYQSSLRGFESSYIRNCKGSLLQVSVLICKLSLSKTHTWCQGIECKNARRYPTKICIIKFDRLTSEKA